MSNQKVAMLGVAGFLAVSSAAGGDLLTDGN
jgi:hypothetical protein